MAEQLSQSQIDALLKRMSSGEVDVEEPAHKAREYDFRSPKKFTKEQLKALIVCMRHSPEWLPPIFRDCLAQPVK